MGQIPPVLSADEISHATIEDIRDALRIYVTEYSYTEAFERIVTGKESAALIKGLIYGRTDAEHAYKLLRDEFLAKWSSTRSLTVARGPGVIRGLRSAAEVMRHVSGSAKLESAADETLERIAQAFGVLDDCPGVGATVASKIISAMRPDVAMMWDVPIAEAYGFARTSAGYRRFLILMRDVARRVDALCGGHATRDLLCPAQRKWIAPLAKVLDEWHWVRITRSHH